MQYGRTPLLLAIEKGKDAAASVLVEKMRALGGAAEQALSTVDKYGRNVLHHAAARSVRASCTEAAAEGMTDIAKAVLNGASNEAAAALLAAQNKASHCIAFDNLGP